MIILSRIYWFFNWLVIAFIVSVVVVIVLRMIANAANLNPFGWSSITIRRLTDPVVAPVRRAAARFGVDQKYAPLVTIIVTIVMGWLLLQLVSGVANTIAGLLISVPKLAIAPIIGYVLYGLLSLYILVMFMRVIFSWVALGYGSRLMRFLINATEPLFGPLRRMIPPMGGFDISPIIAFLVVWVVQRAIAGTLLHGWPIMFFG
jgi:YggT family protein